jgi:hypothetical protein
MDERLDEIKKYIQSFFDQGTVTIVGSGLSCAEGISGMGGLSKELIKDVPNKLKPEDMTCWKKVEDALKNELDLESALRQNKVTDEVEKVILDITYELISREDEVIFLDIIERERKLKFSKYLSCFNLDLYNLTVITTNYDLLIEYACETEGFLYTDSYCGKIIAKYSPENAKEEMLQGVKNGKRVMNRYKPHIKLYKPHGSINWKLVNGRLNRINHLHCGDPCIITPGANKYEKGYEIPFDYHIGKMGEEIDYATRLIFIGYGFNDNHLETHLKKYNNMCKPKLIVTRTLSENAKNVIVNYSNTMAIEAKIIDGKICGTKVYSGEEIYELDDINLWDISELIREVF